MLALFVAASGWSFTAPAHAQEFGSKPITKKDLDRVPKWKPPVRSTGEIPSMSLVAQMPAVGDQGHQGSCVGFAVAYARSQMDARDRGLRPDRAERIYSPAFIYNQLNRGVDQGSNIFDALNLVKNVGAATTATMPYNPDDFQSQPSRRALDEAANHRIAGFSQIGSAEHIRSALMNRQAVILINTPEPAFMKGKFETYTDELRRPGLGQGQRDDKHATHAV